MEETSDVWGTMMEQKNEVPQQPFLAFGTPILSAVRIKRGMVDW